MKSIERRRRRALGQHYLVDTSVLDEMLDLAAIRRGERVLEIGTGKGALTRELLKQSDNIEGFEIDAKSYLELREELGHEWSSKLHNDDAFEYKPSFDVLISSLPYSESSRFVEWLSYSRYSRAIVLIQEEFASKITANPGEDAYRAISVIAQASSTIKVIRRIGRFAFSPAPRVNSALVALRWKRSLTPSQVEQIKRLFSVKRKRLGAALRALGLRPMDVGCDPEVRVNTLSPESVISLLSRISEGRYSSESP